MTPRVLQPEELRNYWPEIEYGLKEVLRKTPTARWIPEDVYAAILYKKAVCVMGMVNEDLHGFFVGKPHENGIFVWAVYSEGNLDEGVQHLMNYAKATNCKHISFQTDRKGWNKVAKKYGFQPNVWRMEI